MDDLALRSLVYRHFADTGGAPTTADLEPHVDDPDAALRRLHDRHFVVLDEDGEIRMALPFSARPTDHRVRFAGQSWWANCAWDALAIAVALDVDAHIESVWVDTGEPLEFDIVDGTPTLHDGFIHFAVPARRWWDDIVET